MFSQTAEYALRAMAVLASRPAAQTAHQIAACTQTPADYLFKVLQALGRAGLVIGQRGKHGGFSLARPASQISILEVVNAVDPIRRIEHCPLRIASHGTRLCPLHRKLDAALKTVEDLLASTTLAELLEGPVELRPLCGGFQEASCAIS
ncbi:MAG: Rrf2 family transcriptional regulator [Bryobacteraceae bacterium]|nr:Rrf2 family transcriptional regulator [Bryobacteraceae bacterium]MDW8377461.1 Rrf2 family transcriptional regulator [Bryobacterales bacterium]